MIQFDFDKITDDLTSKEMRAMQSVCSVVKTSFPILIFGCTGDVRRSIARQIADHSLYKSSGNSYFDCGIEYGSVPLTAGTVIIDNIDYASEFIQVRLQDYMAADLGNGHIRFIFCSETNLVERVETGKLLRGVFYNMIMSINADHVVM